MNASQLSILLIIAQKIDIFVSYAKGIKFVSAPEQRGSREAVDQAAFDAGAQVITGDWDGRWFAEHNCPAALQRSDFYLYGTVAGPAGAAALLDHLRTRLPVPVTPEGARQ